MLKNDPLNPFHTVELSSDAVKLANAVYNTYWQEKYPYLIVSVERLFELFGYSKESSGKKERQFIRELFEELNEPIRVINFKYGIKVYDWEALQFCVFEKSWEDEDDFIELTINEMYIAVMKEYLEEPFLPLQ